MLTIKLRRELGSRGNVDSKGEKLGSRTLYVYLQRRLLLEDSNKEVMKSEAINLHDIVLLRSKLDQAQRTVMLHLKTVTLAGYRQL